MILGGPQCFGLAFHSVITLRMSWYAPPDTGVSNLILVALERLPSMEGTVKIWIICTFLRGAKIQGSPFRGAVCEADGEVAANLRRPLRLGFAEPPPLREEALGCAPHGFPYEGKLSAVRLTERLSQICDKTQTANSVCGLERKKRAQRIRSLACKASFRRGRF